MATLEAVTKELQNLNGIVTPEVHLAEQQNVRLDILSGKTDETNRLLGEVVDVLRQFMNHIPEQIVRGFEPIVQSIENNTTKSTETISNGFEALADIQKVENLKQDREEAGETDTDKNGKKPKGTFMKAVKSGREEDLGDIFGFKKFQQMIGSNIGNLLAISDALGLSKVFGFVKAGVMAVLRGVVGILKSVALQLFSFAKTGFLGMLKFLDKPLKMLRAGMMALMTGVRTAIMSAVSAIMPALVALAPFIAIGAVIAAGVTALVMGINSFIDDFNAQEGSVFDKILAGLLGFVDGFMKILTIPLDWILNLTAKVLDFFGFDGAAKVLEEFSLTDMVDDFTDGILEFLLKIKDGIVGFAADAWNKVKSFFGFGGEEETKETVKTLSREERMVLEQTVQAREEGKARAIAEGYSEEEATQMAESGKFDPGQFKSATRKISTAQMQERLAGGESIRRLDQRMGQRGMVIGDQPAAPTTRDPATGKLGRVIGGSPGSSSSELTEDRREVGGVVVEVNGERRTEFTEEEIKKINAARNAAITMGNPDPLPNFEANVVSSSQSTSTDSTLVYPVTNYAGEVVGAFNTPEEAAQWAIENQGIVVNAMPKDRVVAALQDDTATAVATPAMNAINSIVTSDATSVGQSVLNDLSSDSSSVVSGSNDRSEMNETMIQETTKLNDNRSEVGGAGGIVAPTVNANNNSTNVTSNTTNVHGIPSAVDKSDRTDRRGAFRGRAI